MEEECPQISIKSQLSKSHPLILLNYYNVIFNNQQHTLKFNFRTYVQVKLNVCTLYRYTIFVLSCNAFSIITHKVRISHHIHFLRFIQCVNLPCSGADNASIIFTCHP